MLKLSHTLRLLLAGLLVVQWLPTNAVAQDANGLVLRYTLIELPAPDGGESRAYALNQTGQIVGWATAEGSRHAAHWHARVFTDIHGTVHFDLEHLYPLYTQDYGEAYDISDGDQIVGTARTSVVCPPEVVLTNSFVFRPAVLTDLGTTYPGEALTNLGTWGTPCDTAAWDSAATGISNANHVVGWADTTDGVARAFLVTPVDGYFFVDELPPAPDPNDTPGDEVNDLMWDLGTLSNSDPVSAAHAVNDSGQVTGYSYTILADGTSAYHAFRLTPQDANSDGTPDTWFAGSDNINNLMSDLGTLNGQNSWGRDINNAGQVVGESDYDTPDGSHLTRGFLWDNGVMTNLGSLATDPDEGFSSAAAINNAGQIVGWAEDDDRERHAFIHEDGEMQDLNDLLYLVDEEGFPVTPRVVLREARDINDDGVIVGWGTIGSATDAQTIGFLLNPTLVDPNAIPDPNNPQVPVTPTSGGSDTGTVDSQLIFGTPGNLGAAGSTSTDPNAPAPTQSPMLCGVFPVLLAPVLLSGMFLMKVNLRRWRRA